MKQKYYLKKKIMPEWIQGMVRYIKGAVHHEATQRNQMDWPPPLSWAVLFPAYSPEFCSHECG